MQNLAPDTPHREVLWLVYTQMILARTLPCFEMVEKNSVGSDDIIYRSVAYMAAHFREDFSLTQMAEDLATVLMRFLESSLLLSIAILILT